MKETRTLYPLTPNGGGTITKEFEVITDLNAYIDGLKANGATVKTAKKDCTVTARVAKVGETVDTRPRTIVDGKVYTFTEAKRTVDEKKAGFIVVTNPDGEEYMMSEDKFNARYTPTEDGKYKSTGATQSFIEVPDDVIITPENWGGETQAVTAGGLISVTDPTDHYGITNAAFAATYKEVSQSGDPVQ